MRRNNFPGILIISATLLINAGGLAFAQESYQNNDQYLNVSNQYYNRGMDYLKSSEFSKAISELEQALKLNAQDVTIRNNLAYAYISRGTYLFNKRINLSSAANDYRCAIYYLKYDENTVTNPTFDENISIATKDLMNVLQEQKINLNAKSRFKMAKELRGQGHFKEAIIEFNEALGDNSLHNESLEALGDIMRVLQKDYKAAEYYDRALSNNPNDAGLHLKFARALNKTGNFNAAIKEYNMALNGSDTDQEVIEALESIWKSKLQENPQDATAHMNMGVVLQKKGDFQAAMAEYQTASSLNPANEVIRLNMGTLFQAQGDIDTAIKAYNTILQVNPNNTLAHYYRATALQKRGMIKDAISEYLAVLKLDPTNSAAKKSLYEAARQFPTPDEVLSTLAGLANDNPNDALAQYNFAYELHSKKRIDEALPYYQRAIALDSKYIDAYLNLASIYKEKTQYQEAVSTLQNALTVDPNNVKAKDLIKKINAEALYSKYQSAAQKYADKDYQGAINEYLTIQNPDAEAYIGLGAAYQALENSDEAEKAYNKALILEKNNSTALYSLGTVYYSKKNYSKAKSLYQRALTYDPENPDIKDALKAVNALNSDAALEKGLKEYNAGKYLSAMATLNQVIKDDPDNSYAYYYRGLVNDGLKKYLLAIADYRKAVEKSADLTDAYYSIGIDYDTLKNYPEAKKAYQKYVTLSKEQDSEYIKYAKQRLKMLK